LTSAERSLAAALALKSTLHEPGTRERYRALLARAIDQAACAETASALVMLAKAHAARAEDALHGAGQLSLSAQRAPTSEACSDGWRRVEAIVAVAEASARAAASAAQTIAPPSRVALTAAGSASAAAGAARRIVAERNDAYTFHTDGGFSFGEGWHVAAAAVLAGVAVQVEPGHARTSEAERFLHDVGVSARLQPYRSRPRANKQTTEIVARAFRSDPRKAQRKLRAAFLGDAAVRRSVTDWTDARLARERTAKRVLLWTRDGAHHPGRNTSVDELLDLTERARRARLEPVWIGDALRGLRVPEGVVDVTLFWKDPAFRSADGRRVQLQFFEHLRDAHGVVGQLGVTSAGMDGPALLGLPTIYLTDAANVRMRAWVGAVPGYEEVVREGRWLERITDVLSAWAR
jgi:hypothetical protein